jgi:negative regulator of sigma E activity
MNSEDREFQETLELLREAHREPIEEAHYAAVRARVMAKLATERRPWRRWIWAYGFAAAALAAVLVFVGRPSRVQQPARPISLSARTERPVAGTAADQRVRPTSVGRRKRLSHRVDYQVIGPPALHPLVVKLVTDDPNIVIYWISGE